MRVKARVLIAVLRFIRYHISVNAQEYMWLRIMGGMVKM